VISELGMAASRRMSICLSWVLILEPPALGQYSQRNPNSLIYRRSTDLT
jgi:hypothetical protein